MTQKNPWIEKKEAAQLGGGAVRQEAQHAQGKRTVRERIASILDPQSFEEIDQLRASPHINPAPPTDGVVTGFGTINGTRVALYAQDFTIHGGSLGFHHAQKICKIMDMAAKIGCPIIGLIDSGGARIQEGIHALAGYGDIFLRNARYSGVVPQITLILGPCAGGAVYSPAMTDFILTTNGISQLFITGPQVIAEVLHQNITKEELGGASIHTKKSGVAHLIAQNEDESCAQLHALLSYLPTNYLASPPPPSLSGAFTEGSGHHQNLSAIVPEEENKPYNMKNIITNVADPDSFFELQEHFAPNIITGFARIARRVIGIVANQPLHKAGVLDIDASCKAARFIQFCDSFNIPIISLVDIPGFLPGIDQEHQGIIRHGAKLLYAYAQATIPKITVILRKAYGGAYIVMGSKHLGADMNFAWPTAHIAVMGAPGAVSILHAKQLAHLDPTTRAIEQQRLESEYRETYLNPFVAAEYGYIDAIIEPNQTRAHLIQALAITQEKVERLPQRKHGNIPL